MPKIVWRDDAKQQLRDIANYIKARNPSAAVSYAEGIRDACSGLSALPEQGRRYDSRYRLIVYRNHVVFYRPDAGSDTVEIIAVIDGRRDVAAILSGLPRD
ncbi:type II toxin-antitoxin system RelE/ParE family toxin [Mesorhizobium sp. CAU 1732]|uniref:type II toxin-antitoxin system RelE/ParE family toxin n=1 Tax=Mesorhizobium sp. CAU 1732 TaxID=3140358 RepID=UPI00326052B6